MYRFIPTKKPLLLATYKVAHRITKVKKPHTISKTLVKPCALKMTEIVCCSDQRRKLECIPMSNNAVNLRIHDISENILKQAMEKLASSPFPFSLQLDESTNVSYCSQLVSYVRYLNGHKIKEEFLYCESLLDSAKASDVFKMVNKFLSSKISTGKRN